jgi:hypothetical protein
MNTSGLPVPERVQLSCGCMASSGDVSGCQNVGVTTPDSAPSVYDAVGGHGTCVRLRTRHAPFVVNTFEE